MKTNKKQLPKYKKGDRLVYMHENPEFIHPLDDNMVVDGKPNWRAYECHPNGGYWSYPIKDKANECPEDFLTPYVEGQEEYTIELPCHIYFKMKKF
jgi:hypothetical protein